MQSYLAKSIYLVLFSVSVLLIITGWSLGFSGNKSFVAFQDVKLTTVDVGDFYQKVNGYGVLQSKNKRLLTAAGSAIVDDIKLKPGAIVSADSVILTLKNPQLETLLQNAMAELHNTKTAKRRIYLEQQRELLQHESQLAELEARAQLANLQVEAQEPLLASGVISVMEAKRIKLEASQLNERLNLEKRRFDKLIEVHREQLSIQDDAIAQSQVKFNSVKEQLEQLVVKAGLDGVLQRLPVSLGQSVNAGDELALVGDVESLIAEIKVPQLQANLIQVGSEAEVDSRHGLVAGQVLRVDPVVNDGAVIVDIQLPEKLSKNIRPMQMVDAVILGKKRTNIASVKKPKGVTEGMRGHVFKMIDEFEAIRVPVQFGQVSGDVIEVVSGLKPGDQIIATLKLDELNVQAVGLVK